jgi:superfamily II DNA/RNA helicase
MPLPTLLVAGNLMPTLQPDDKLYKETKHELDKYKPIDYIMTWFKTRYPGIGRQEKEPITIADRVLILRSKTGSGKSSALPPMLYKTFIYGTTNEKQSPIVLCTQPRRVTAKELATEAATKSYFVPLELGVNVGYQTGIISEKAKYGLTYATIGVLLQQLKMRDDELILRKYRFIVLDEVHERSVDMDQVFYLLAGFMKRVLPNPRAPFIVMTSATFDPELFAKFFNVFVEKPMLLEMGIWGQPNIIDVEGFAYPVEYNWLTKSSSNFINDIVSIVKDIHTVKGLADKPSMCDILIFVPGVMYMDTIIQQLSKQNFTGLLVLKLEGGVVADKGRDYVLTMAAPDKLPVGTIRRLIVSTNVAETGLTIETLKYVIDYGFNKSTEYNPECCIEELIEKPAPQSRIQQRRGRVGRKAPGVFYPLYTKETFDSLPKLQLPAILESDFTDMLLNIAAINADGFSIFDDVIDKMLEPPSGQALCNAITKLSLIGFITPINLNKKDFKISPLGDIASKFSMIRPETIRMILNGYCEYPSMPINLDVSIRPVVAVKDLITIAAIIENGATILKKMNEEKISNILQIGVPDSFSVKKSLADIWTLTQNELMIELFVFNSVVVILNNGEVPHEWAEKHGINIGAFSSIAQTRNEIMQNMINIGFDINHGEEYSINSININQAAIVNGIKRAIEVGFKANTMISKDTTKSKYIHEYIYSKTKGIHSFKCRPAEPINDILKKSSFPERIIAVELGLEQTFGKDVDFNEYMPMLKKIIVL